MRCSTLPAALLLLLLALPMAPAVLAAPLTPPTDTSGLIPEGDVQFAREFIADYQSADVARVSKWVHPRRGVSDQRELKTKESFQASLPTLSKAIKTGKLTWRFDYGQFYGERFYKALYRQSGGKLGDVRKSFDIICVFEEIGGKWYLVQVNHYTAVSAERLMVGGKAADERLVAKTLGGRSFSLAYATGKNKAVLLSFFDAGQDLLLDINIKHLRTMKKWTDELKREPIYVMNVTERTAAETNEYLKINKIPMPGIVDGDSLWHHVLDVDAHPYLLLVDHEGTVRAMHRGGAPYDPAVYTLFRAIVSDVVAEAKVASGGQKSAPKAVNPSSKF
ncbi:MAG TPA: hypothetical protein VEI97_12955 [bacterium]|nr:hypothetical protein [bacterium]